MFCLDEPDRQRASGRRTTARWRTRASGGEAEPFVRLDLRESPIEEAERCLAAGARGIKRRGRRGSSRRRAACAGLRAAADRRVPILIHGGRGLHSIADALALMDRYEPQLIVAHAGIADLAALARAASAGGPASSSTRRSGARSTCSTSTGSSRRSRCSTPPTIPTGSSLPALLGNTDGADGGLDETQLEAMLGERAHRIAAGGLAYELTAPRGPQGISHPLTFARIHQYLSMATPLLWTRQADTIGVLGLALNACDERSNGHREETERIPRAARHRARPLAHVPRGRERAGARAGRPRGLPAPPSREHRLRHLAWLSGCGSTATTTKPTSRSAARSPRHCAKTSA